MGPSIPSSSAISSPADAAFSEDCITPSAAYPSPAPSAVTPEEKQAEITFGSTDPSRGASASAHGNAEVQPEAPDTSDSDVHPSAGSSSLISKTTDSSCPVDARIPCQHSPEGLENDQQQQDVEPFDLEDLFNFEAFLRDREIHATSAVDSDVRNFPQQTPTHQTDSKLPHNKPKKAEPPAKTLSPIVSHRCYAPDYKSWPHLHSSADDQTRYTAGAFINRRRIILCARPEHVAPTLWNRLTLTRSDPRFDRVLASIQRGARVGHRPLVQERYDYQLPSVVLEDMFRKGFTEQDMFLGASTLLRISKNDEPNYEGGPDGEFDLRSRH